ncbi:MAG: hypothetical protein COB59_12125 [Rhodospirillaceae bacterium]|nr:MAG: hypothetical protein COB59_12125 [Rhodospirillaceae bacterium]
MVEKFVFVLCVLSLVFTSGSLVRADEAEDQLVEQGIAFYDDEEFAKAKAILLPLAEAGHAKAMNLIGRMHDGTMVFPNDAKVECDWYEKSAKADYASAMNNLSICYEKGLGRPRNIELMLNWRKQSAIKGSKLGMINLARVDGKFGKDYRYWMNQAVQHGSIYAKVSLNLRGYEQDVPDLKIQDTLCVYIRILIFDGSFLVCD